MQLNGADTIPEDEPGPAKLQSKSDDKLHALAQQQQHQTVI